MISSKEIEYREEFLKETSTELINRFVQTINRLFEVYSYEDKSQYEKILLNLQTLSKSVDVTNSELNDIEELYNFIERSELTVQ